MEAEFSLNVRVLFNTRVQLAEKLWADSGMATSLSLRRTHRPTLRPKDNPLPTASVHSASSSPFLYVTINPSRLTALAFLYHSCKCKEPSSGLNGPLSVLDGITHPLPVLWILHRWGKSNAWHCNGSNKSGARKTSDTVTGEDVRDRTETAYKNGKTNELELNEMNHSASFWAVFQFTATLSGE